jgi:hypothetical protein
MRFALTFVLALLGLVVSGRDVAAQSNTCTNVSGVIEGQIIGPTAQCGGGLTEIGTFTGTGDGTFVACITPVRTNGKGTLFLSLTHTYTTLSGDTFTTTDTVVAAPVQPPVYRINNRVNVTGGTGALADAFGFFRTHGTVNLQTGVLSLTYRGRLCTP